MHFVTTEYADVQTEDSLQKFTTADKYSELAAPLSFFGHISFASVDVLPVQKHKYRCC